MIDRVFMTGFYFGLTVAAALFFGIIYFVFIQNVEYLWIAGGFAVLAVVEYIGYQNFVNDIRMSLNRRPKEEEKDGEDM